MDQLRPQPSLGGWRKCDCLGLTCLDNDNSSQPPLSIHRALLGTHEHFMGFLITRAAGTSPLWLAPDRVRVLMPNDDAASIAYAKPIVAELPVNRVRVDADFSATLFKATISNAEQLRVRTKLEVIAQILADICERKPRAYARSKRSRFITLSHAATKSCTNFFSASELP